MSGFVKLCHGCPTAGLCVDVEHDPMCSRSLANRLRDADMDSGHWDRGVYVVGDWRSARVAVVEWELARFGIAPTPEQLRSLRWMCAESPETIENLVGLMTVGRPMAVPA